MTHLRHQKRAMRRKALCVRVKCGAAFRDSFHRLEEVLGLLELALHDLPVLVHGVPPPGPFVLLLGALPVGKMRADIRACMPVVEAQQ